ncbi:MAG: hypothetical protein M9918_08560 [Anaerolineae bacterium]|nr:hypothetical protein [Anaerolineae bacterium]
MMGNRLTSALALLCIALIVIVAACQSDSDSAEPQLDPAAAATQTRQSEVIAVLTFQAMTPRPTRGPRNFSFTLPSNLTDTPTPPAASTGTPTPTATPEPRAVLLDIPYSAEPVAPQATIISPAGKPVAVALHHDEATLYIVFSGLEVGNVALFPELLIDPRNDSDQEVGDDNRWFHQSTTSCTGQGADFLWQTCGEAQDWIVSADLTDTGVAGMAIPFAMLGIDPKQDHVIGVLPILFYLDENGVEQRITWPDSAEIEQPITWAGATIGN